MELSNACSGSFPSLVLTQAQEGQRFPNASFPIQREEIKWDEFAMGQDLGWFSYRFVVLNGVGPSITSSHDRSYPWPASRTHLIRWKGPPVSPCTTSDSPAQLSSGEEQHTYNTRKGLQQFASSWWLGVKRDLPRAANRVAQLQADPLSVENKRTADAVARLKVSPMLFFEYS